jgi:RNA polymerase sigma-70 factor (ECF subfamily)
MAGNYDLFEQCKKEDARAQRILYDLFKGKLMGLCRRYTRNREEAQDVLQETFIRIFTRISQLESPEKFEAWMKSIAVRTAINHYHKTKVQNLMFSKIDAGKNDVNSADITIENLTDEHLVNLINDLPEGCRMVFNLFAVEGYSHAEVAEMLQISESTSRSQLHHARFLLREKLKCQSLASYYEKFA